MASPILENTKNSSDWFDVEVVPEAYRLPLESRPGKFVNEIPYFPYSVIDLSLVDCSSEDKLNTIQQILKAGQEFGVFQVMNHGIPEELIEETVSVLNEFFSLPAEEKAHPEDGGWVYLGSSEFTNNVATLWRENLKIPCHPMEDNMKRWPQKPSRYREVMAAYLSAITKLSSRILELICEGLGLEADYLKDVAEVQLLTTNNYPPCPDPSLTMGLLPHKDSSFITLLYQGSTSGLQVQEDGKWVNVEAIPNAFLINIGNQLEIISNGMLKSPMHRVVTNPEKLRLSIATFTNPSPSYIVKPAAALINESNPPLYKPIKYADYVSGSQIYGEPLFGPNTKILFKPRS